MKKILILGANSAIARATARLYAERGDALFLVGRDAGKLAATAADLAVRGGAPVATQVADLATPAAHGALIAAAKERLGGLDAALIAHGELGDQKAAEASYDATERLLAVNLLSPVSLLTALASDFERQGHGCLAVITSVAGDRGRASNYVYGTAKGALSIFLSGLRHRLAARRVAVVDLKLGFVDTPMTAAFKKGPLWATPAGVASKVVKAMDRGTPVAYIPGFWRLIMLIIRSIPEPIFLRLKL
jgi:short-subunit dehydrogenase